MADSNKGYIKLYRELQDNPLWSSEPFSKGQAWVDMLLRANHQYNEFIIGNELIVVERGQFFTSELKLAEKWKWSRKKVRAYLNLLKTLKMATTVGTSKGTTITIENYGLYQGEGTTEDTTVGTSKEHRRNIEGYTNNNDKELIKNDKEIKTDKKPPKKTYGEFKNVKLTIEEYEKIIEKFPHDYQDRIEDLSIYMDSKGKTYKSHYATILNWSRMEEKGKRSSNPFKAVYLQEEKNEQKRNSLLNGDNQNSLPRILPPVE